MIGVKHEDTYAVTEFFEMLKVPWEWYEPAGKYDVVIARYQEVPEYQGNLINLNSDEWRGTFSWFSRSEPLIELINRMRNELLKYNFPLAEILPSPWGYPYIFVPTHDVDNISVRQISWRTAIVAALRCFRQKKYREGFQFVTARIGFGKDPWDLFDTWMGIEDELGIRSTFYVIPPHEVIQYAYHKYREISYAIDWHRLATLEGSGWEVGVHGMNNWISPEIGYWERVKFEAGLLSGRCGNRTHWLHRNVNSFRYLDQAGYDYDASLGWNETVGFPAGITQIYRPRDSAHMLVLPLNIQDVALFNKSCWILHEDPIVANDSTYSRYPCLNLSEEKAMEVCNKVIDDIKTFGGVVTVSFHYENIVPPNNWKQFYVDLVKRAKSDGAWITTAQKAVDWFRARREIRILTEQSGKQITIHCENASRPSVLPHMAIRLHIPKDRIESIDSEFVAGETYVDIWCSEPEITVVLK